MGVINNLTEIDKLVRTKCDILSQLLIMQIDILRLVFIFIILLQYYYIVYINDSCREN